MLNLQKNTVNTIVVTLNEKKLFPAAPNNFRFIHDDQAKTEKVFRMAELSPVLIRYNKYELTEVAAPNEDLPNGLVNLNYGWGRYEVYEDPDNTFTIYGSPIEVGRYFVGGYDATMNNNTVNNIYI